MNFKNKNKYNFNLDSNNSSTNNWCKNLTDVKIPNDVLEIISLGPNFNPRGKFTKPDLVNTIKELESKFERVNFDDSVKDKFRRNMCGIFQSQLRNRGCFSLYDRSLSNKLAHTKSLLKQNPEVFFTRADKGNLSVCLYLSDYQDRMHKLLSDTDTYICLLYTSPSPRDRTRSRMPSSA